MILDKRGKNELEKNMELILQKKKFSIQITIGDRVQTLVREHHCPSKLNAELQIWAKKKFGLVIGDTVKTSKLCVYGLGWNRDLECGVVDTGTATRGFTIRVSPYIEPVKKPDLVSAGNMIGDGVAEGLAIDRMKELKVFAKGKDEFGREETVTVDDIFGKKPAKYSRPPSPSSKGPVPNSKELVSNHFTRIKNNDTKRKHSVPLDVQFDLILDSIKDDLDTVQKQKKVETPYRLVRLIKRTGKKGIGQHSQIVETCGSGLDRLKYAAKLLYETTESQYMIVKDGKVIWATKEW